MNYEDKGELELAGADDANVPVNSFLHEPDEDSPKWRWTADNFMPRKGYVSQGAYEIEADTREALLDAVRKHVVPLYEAALENLKTVGSCYYWERKKLESA
jgi:hypothetical protein